MDPSLSAAGAVRLADWGVIRAEGPDAATFLHGQLTHDMVGLQPMQARLAGFCSAKGRLQATFVAWRRAPDEFLLMCTAELVPALVKRLSMFVLRARCRISDASAELAPWGVVGRTEGALPLSPARLGDGPVARGLLVLPAGVDPDGWPPVPSDVWRWLEVHAATPRVVAATVDHFVPQMVNLELVDGVSFGKGCYPGQEIVARSQYRGTLKRRGFVVHSSAALSPAQEIYHTDDPEQPAGQVVLAASLEGRHAAFVELKLSAARHGTLHAGAVDGPRLELVPMPYELPAEPAPVMTAQ